MKGEEIEEEGGVAEFENSAPKESQKPAVSVFFKKE